jgi:hypothetical protein
MCRCIHVYRGGSSIDASVFLGIPWWPVFNRKIKYILVYMCRDDMFFIFEWNLFLGIPYVEILDPPLHVYVFLAFASEKKRHGDKLKGVYVFLVRLSVQLYTDCFLVR